MVKAGEPPLVPESVLKRRHDLDELVRKRQAYNEIHSGKKQKNKKGFYVVNPGALLAKARNQRNNEKRFLRVSKKGMQKRAENKKVVAKKVVDDQQIDIQTNSFGAKFVFVIRIRNNHSIPKQVKLILMQMRLRYNYQGVFLKYTEETRRQLHLVEPWVVYGTPSAASVKDLIERRGFAQINSERIPLSDNTVIERALGEKHNILCVEDLVCLLTEAGKDFDIAASFMWPFQLSDSKTKFERQTLKLTDGKEYGDRGQAIEDYIQQVL